VWVINYHHFNFFLIKFPSLRKKLLSNLQNWLFFVQLLFKFKGHLLKPKPKIFVFNLYFEFPNIHISHLTQLPMITMALKWHHKNISNKITILYINSVSLLVCPRRYILNPCEQGVVFVFNVPSWTCTRKKCPSVKVLKPRSFLIKLSPWTRGPKNYSGPRILTFYFYFYVRFRAATAVVDGGGIFGIWRVGEEIWVRFFWA
jgi:hypothetical protein